MKIRFFLASTVAVCLMGLSSQAAIVDSSVQSSVTSQPLLLAHEGHDHTGETMQHEETPAMGEDPHSALEIPAGQLVPTVNLVAHPDAHQGWNLEVQVTNFRFAPEHLSQPSSPTEGHAHLYIDGEKVTRLYGNWYYLGNLPPGQHEITVSLNTNTHETLMHNGEPIQSTVRVDAPTATP